jgi:haloalkane dehalogenase
MEFLETPEGRFEGLKDYPFTPKYHQIGSTGLRMNYVDEGPPDAAPVLMLHGEPSWSYLYRFMIPPCVEAGHRVVVPDLIGFGRSSKPTRIADYTYQGHCDWLRNFIEGRDLRGITLFCQDWGSLIGLRLAAEMEDRFDRIVLGNGGLPDGKPPSGSPLRAIAGVGAFLAWRTFARWSRRFTISRILQFGSQRELDADELRAYDAPFPDERYKAGARAFPLIVPLSPRDPAIAANQRAWSVLERSEKPFLTTFSDGDPITGSMEKMIQKRVPGARGLAHRRVAGGHFLQEDSGPELAQAINELIEKTPT